MSWSAAFCAPADDAAVPRVERGRAAVAGRLRRRAARRVVLVLHHVRLAVIERPSDARVDPIGAAATRATRHARSSGRLIAASAAVSRRAELPPPPPPPPRSRSRLRSRSRSRAAAAPPSAEEGREEGGSLPSTTRAMGVVAGRRLPWRNDCANSIAFAGRSRRAAADPHPQRRADVEEEHPGSSMRA